MPGEECSMVCEETGEVIGLFMFKENLLIRAKKLGFPIITSSISGSTVLVRCGCGGNFYKCAEL